MANYPQLDNARGVWNMKEVYDAVMGGYWPNALSRATFGGGNTGSISNVIDYITIASTGNAASFGDLRSKGGGIGATSNNVRGIFAGGGTGAGGSGRSIIGYVTLATLGNENDFGDLHVGYTDTTATSGNHGGVQ